MTQDPIQRPQMDDDDTLCDYELVQTPDTPTQDEELPLRPKEKQDDADRLRLALHPLPTQDGVIVSVQPPIGQTRVPCDIVLIIDISGSMGAPAPAPSMADGEKEVDALTVLDLTKHAARAIIETMGDDDRLGVVTFTDEAEVVLPLTYMNKSSKTKAWDLVKNIRPQGMTNLWHGILEGKGLLDGKQRPGVMPAMMLLTDGIPNRGCPAQGYVPRLQTYNLPAPIHCFGFGHSIGSCLLQSIAEVSSGNFAFISDASMLATVFIHAMANFQSTFAQGSHLTIQASNGLTLAQTMGEFIRSDEQPTKKPEDDYQSVLTIPLGSLQFGQSRDILFKYGTGSGDKATITAQLTCHPLDKTDGSLTATCRQKGQCDLSAEDIAFHRNRSAFCSFATSLAPIGKGRERQRLKPDTFAEKRYELEQLAKQVKEQRVQDEANNALLEDLTDQITLALSRDYVGSWGYHYVLSMYNAHFKQLRMSFKDPGQLQYSTSSPVFTAACNSLADLFDNLPPPAPTVTIRDQSGATRKVARSMRWYHDPNNPCFAAETPVTLADGTTIAIRQLRAGASVWTPAGPRRVAGVLETHVADAVLCSFGSLRITPWHPIRWAGRWKFPADIVADASAASWYTGAIYSVQLEADDISAAHAICVGGITAVTLGHGVVSASDEHDARAHAFFGDYRAVHDALQSLPIGAHGQYVSGGTCRGADGRVAGFVPPPAATSTPVGVPGVHVRGMLVEAASG